MIKNANVVEIRSWKKNENGCYVSPAGDQVTLGNGAKIGDDVKIGDRVTSKKLNEMFRYNYLKAGDFHIFTKWITENRSSPHWGSSKVLEYRKGAIIECPEAVVSDQQCAIGLHVFRFGYRPEWAGLCNPDHEYIPIRVKVRSEDICFAELPGNDAKLRVKRLEVLD